MLTDTARPAVAPYRNNQKENRMKAKRVITTARWGAAFVFTAASCIATEIQTTGEIGSPSATTTISGKELPANDPKFGGVIKDGALQ
jgi:hypothetical protein